MKASRRLEQVAGADAVPREFLRRLASSFDRHGMSVLPTARRGAVAVPGIIEPLSAREREVLALLATGHPNRMIADELVITVDTVKRHVSRRASRTHLTCQPAARGSAVVTLKPAMNSGMGR